MVPPNFPAKRQALYTATRPRSDVAFHNPSHSGAQSFNDKLLESRLRVETNIKSSA